MTERFLVFNPLSENCYLLTDEESRKTFIIDPGFSNDAEFARLKQLVSDNGLIPERILLTHTHFDHAMGAGRLRETYGIKVYGHPLDEELLARMGHYLDFFGFEKPVDALRLDGHLSDGERLTLGKTSIEVIHVPGHTHGCVAFYVKEEKKLFSGDTLFQGNVGRTDFNEGSAVEMRQSLTRLMRLPDDTVVLPGHGCATTIGDERVNNPYLP